ncbi:hypothetical protein N1851_002166 [Merluccius polli]|uniref:Uncharacterized protein n=1 Tax=Merluccius polli TaxID=89951 RepID=A0AA47NC00_MERPO|nr:hypothetical protein N1851_002166 [Merluccius polli]
MRVSTSKSEAMVLSRKKRWPVPSGWGESSWPKYLGVLFTTEAKREREIDRRMGAASAVMQALYRTVVVKRELSREAKLSIHWSFFIPTLTYGHELWRKGEELSDPGGPRSRTAAPPDREEPVEVVQAPGKDPPWPPPFGGAPGTANWEKTPGPTQEPLEGLYPPAGLETPRWRKLPGIRSGMPAASATQTRISGKKMDGWMDGGGRGWGWGRGFLLYSDQDVVIGRRYSGADL